VEAEGKLLETSRHLSPVIRDLPAKRPVFSECGSRTYVITGRVPVQGVNFLLGSAKALAKLMSSIRAGF
jgi:hypothetical protein